MDAAALHEIVLGAMRQERQDREPSVVLVSDACPNVMWSLLSAAGLFRTAQMPLPALPDDFAVPLRGFDWGSDMVEVEAGTDNTPAACARLAEYVAAGGV